MAGEGRKLIGSTDTLLRERNHGAVNPTADHSPDLGSRTVKEQNSVEGTSYHRVETALKCCSCTEIYRNRLWFKIITFSLVLIFDLADMFSDWSLYRDVVHVESGLVVGPPEVTIIYALLIFSTIGTATFSVEIVNVWLEIFYHNPMIDPELLCVLTIWLEDIPQITLNIFIAVCREDAISYFQIVKAGVIILGSFVRVLMGFIRFSDRKIDNETNKKNPKSGPKHLTYRVLIFSGLFLLFFSSLVVCFLTLFERSPDGQIEFGTPKGLFHGKYDREKFFSNVSIYLTLPILAFNNSTNNTSTNWLRLTSINEIQQNNGGYFKISYDNDTMTKFVFLQMGPNNQSTLEAKECFSIQDQSVLLKGPSDCTNLLANEHTVSHIVKFIFIPEKIPELIFGDIQYNIQIQDQDGCRNISKQPVNAIEKQIDNKNHQHPVIHYYRTKQNISNVDHLIWDSEGNPRFYHQDQDLIDITHVWKTGFGFCQSMGSLAPHRNASVDIECL